MLIPRPCRTSIVITSSRLTAASYLAYYPTAPVGRLELFRGFLFPVTLVLSACLLLGLQGTRFHLGYPQRLQPFLAALFVAGIIFSFLFQHVGQIDSKRTQGGDSFTGILQKVKAGEGLFVVSENLWGKTIPRFQLRTRRGVLLDPNQVNLITYVPAAGPRLEYILAKVYGSSLLDPANAHNLFRASASTWQQRTLAQWQEIRREFLVTQVLMRNQTTMNLPVVATLEDFTLFEIPPASLP